MPICVVLRALKLKNVPKRRIFQLSTVNKGWTPLIQETQAGQFLIDTGPLQAAVSVGQGWGLLDQASLEGRAILAPQVPNPGLVLRTAQGEEFNTRLGVVTSASIEVSGPLRSVLHLTGDHRRRAPLRL